MFPDQTEKKEKEKGFRSPGVQAKGAMRLLLPLSVLWLVAPAAALEGESRPDGVARKTVPYSGDNGRLFREEGVWNYSTMLLREDLGLLLLGAREVIYALDLNQISNKNASVRWEAPMEKQQECKNKGRDLRTECKNYIRILHTMDDGKMYVCGTNAFDPECDVMSYSDGTLSLENRKHDGKGMCPFNPFQSYSSIMADGDLYSATSMNFLGSEPVIMRSTSSSSSSASIRTEFKSSWLNEPNFISMEQMPESQDSGEGDDDKVYVFFSESAVEYDCVRRPVVSRVARICKGDLGGQRTLQKKWTSFLKARVDCPVLESQLPFVIQDTYLWCDSGKHWRSCLFYAVFTPQPESSGVSAVCAYRVSDISAVFSKGKYKTPVTVETSFVKWVMYSGDIPSPRPGACIDNEARKQGINQTLDLPDRTLQFIKDRPLMDQAVRPIDERPLLVWRGAMFTRVIANEVEAEDGKKYHVMFIGTEEGTLVKAVNYDGEMFIIEEVQLFPTPEPIKVLKFSDVTGQLYAGSEYGVVQIPLATCGRSTSCMDCVLARDPYCGWDKTTNKCVAVSQARGKCIQSAKQGDATLCPASGPVKLVDQSVWPGGNLKLRCPPPSNLAVTSWRWGSLPLPSSPRLQVLEDGLLILNASASDAGRYSCLSLEQTRAKGYTTTVANYQVSVAAGSGRGGQTSLQAQRGGQSVAGLQAAVGILMVLLAVLLGWNLYKGHLPLPWRCGGKETAEKNCAGSTETGQETRREGSPLVSQVDNGSNHKSPGENVSAASLQYIDDESTI